MKITPLEIRQKTFEKEFRGYQKEEVHSFLHSLSLEWEKMQNTVKEATKQVETLEKEVSKLKEVESSLYKTLKTAEDTGANMIDQANKMAEIHMRETEMKAESILNDAKNKAHDTIEEAEMIARQSIEEMEDQLKDIMHAYKTLENFRDDLLSDIKGVSTDALDRVERVKAQSKKINVDEFFLKSRRESKKLVEDRLSSNSKRGQTSSEKVSSHKNTIP
ncbi:MAG: DivIVA domain-containing protein, partial [Cyclobacteriaceae bacterium]|nr:DivIVA domain-containing protein [Cyclobacteriaceae bacterium]